MSPALSPPPNLPCWGEGLARHGMGGGVDGFTLHKNPNPALVVPDGHAGTANGETSLRKGNEEYEQ